MGRDNETKKKLRLADPKIFISLSLIVIVAVVLLTDIISSASLIEIVVDFLAFIIVCVLGYIFLINVKEESQSQTELQTLTKSLKNSDAQKDEFISMAAHEMRAPMTAIKGYLSMVLEGVAGDIPEKARGFLVDTSHINDRLIRLVNNMLNVSRIEAGKMVYQMEEEHLSQVVRSVFSQFAPEAERKGLDYRLETRLNIKDKVYVDPEKIEEVIGNLLSNAVKYTNSGFVKVRLTQPGKSIVRFEVSDSGPGISWEEQKNLFQKFHRVETNVGKTTGTGLGLYISKLFIEKFNGKVGVSSQADKGSTFWFELPLVTS